MAGNWNASLPPLIVLSALAVSIAVASYFLLLKVWKDDEDEEARWNGWFDKMPWFALALMLAATILAWGRQAPWGGKGHFDDDIKTIERAIDNRFQSWNNLLKQAGDFAKGQDPNRVAWQQWVDSMHVADTCPGIYGVGYAAYVPESHLQAFLRSVRRSGDERLTVTPPGVRFDYFIVRQIGPASVNEGLLGYDLGSDLAGRLGAEHARDTGEFTISGRMSLPDDTSHASLLYLAPIYDGATPSTPEERQKAIKGWVFARFRREDLFKEIEKSVAGRLRLKVYDGDTPTSDMLLFDSDPSLSASENPLATAKRFTRAGRSWTLVFAPGASFHVPGAAGNPSFVLLVGILLSGLCAVFVWAMRSSRRQAKDLASHMTVHLQQRERALAAGPNGILICDATSPDLPIRYVNNRFEKITGYSAMEALGKNPKFLQGTDRDQKGCHEMRRALREQRECRVILRNYRKDGTPFWNDVTLTPLRGPSGRVTQWVGTQQDVTEQQQSQQRLMTQVAVIRSLNEAPTIEEASGNVLRAICEGQEWDVGVLWRMDARANALRFVDLWHKPEISIGNFLEFNQGASFAKDVGLPGRVWAKGEPLWLEDIQRQPNFPEGLILANEGMISACGFPIANRRGLQGVLGFYSHRIWPLSKNLLLLMVGTGAQISQYMDRQSSEDQAKQLSVLERGMAEYMGEGLLAMDRDGFCIYANAAASKMLGYSVPLLLGQNLHDVLHPANTGATVCDPDSCPLLLSLHRTQAQYVDDTCMFVRQDRMTLPVSLTTSPVIEEGSIQGVVITFLDASARRDREDRLQQALAEKDDLIRALQTAKSTESPAPVSEATGVGESTSAGAVKSILFVEEDKGIRQRMTNALKRKGLNVFPAANAGEALLICEREGGAIDLLVTEALLSHMSGKSLVERVVPLCPNIKILFTSAYGSEAFNELKLLDHDVEFLKKPFHPESLYQKITHILFP